MSIEEAFNELNRLWTNYDANLANLLEISRAEVDQRVRDVASKIEEEFKLTIRNRERQISELIAENGELQSKINELNDTVNKYAAKSITQFFSRVRYRIF